MIRSTASTPPVAGIIRQRLPNRSNSRRPDESDLVDSLHCLLVAKVDGECVIQLLRDQLFWMCELAGSLSAEQIDKVHPPYHWTIRQVIEHCVDAERIFGYRMLRFAAGDATPLNGFDENAYAGARFGLGNFGHLVSEWGFLRQSHLLLLGRLTAPAWNRVGTVDDRQVSVRGLAWLIVAHVQHHLSIIEQRCQVQAQRKP